MVTTIWFCNVKYKCVFITETMKMPPSVAQPDSLANEKDREESFLVWMECCDSNLTLSSLSRTSEIIYKSPLWTDLVIGTWRTGCSGTHLWSQNLGPEAGGFWIWEQPEILSQKKVLAIIALNSELPISWEIKRYSLTSKFNHYGTQTDRQTPPHTMYIYI